MNLTLLTLQNPQRNWDSILLFKGRPNNWFQKSRRSNTNPTCLVSSQQKDLEGVSLTVTGGHGNIFKLRELSWHVSAWRYLREVLTLTNDRILGRSLRNEYLDNIYIYICIHISLRYLWLQVGESLHASPLEESFLENKLPLTLTLMK